MRYDRMPLYPPMGGRCDGGGDCYRMPLFRPEPCMSRGCGCPARTVRLENPACPDEWAEVTLSVDECGNMVICVHRAPPRRCCEPRPRRNGCCT